MSFILIESYLLFQRKRERESGTEKRERSFPLTTLVPVPRIILRTRWSHSINTC